jgi:membrane-associated phospholipid phosphatase
MAAATDGMSQSLSGVAGGDAIDAALSGASVPGPGRSRGLPLGWAVGLAIAAYIVAISFMVLTGRRAFIFKTVLVPGLLLVALVGSRFRAFIQDWMVFLGGVVLFDAVRGFAFATVIALHRTVYSVYPIVWEKTLFGTPALGIPLQTWLRGSGAARWLDSLCIALHASHFAFFLLFGLAIWGANRREFGRWVVVMLLTMTGGLVCYAAVPTVPPWLASTRGLIPPLLHIAGLAYNTSVPVLKTVLDTNPVAAMPSMHMAFPTCCALAAGRTWGARGMAVWIYVAALGVALVYLGEHYAVDVLAGLLLGMVVSVGVNRWAPGTRWLDNLGWCRWTAERHFTAAMAVVLAAVLLSAWSVALVPGLAR